jgi:hypothetical protein
MESNMFFTAFPKMKVNASRVAEKVEKPCAKRGTRNVLVL